MIPKIIHYTWFSGEPFPEKILACINSWKQFLPDYELKLWDMKSLEQIDSMFLREALAEKKWAYAADFVRLYAVYNEGGIYLDTDVQIYKSLDPLLSHRAFIGKENSVHFEGGFTAQYLSSHCFGAEKGHPYIKECLSYFKDRNFITSKNTELPQSLRYNFILLPYIQAEIARRYGYEWRPLLQEKQACREGLIIFPTIFFDPQIPNGDSCCKHLALGSWRVDKALEPTYNLQYKIKWRLLWFFKLVLKKAGYMTIELN